MRLYLLPISTRRTLLYAQRLNVTLKSTDASYIDRATGFAAKKWAEWEKKESGWQHKVVSYGNEALKRIPFEEWGLKSVPPLSARRRDDELRGKEKVQLVFPRAAIPLHKAEAIIKSLATEREGFHRKRMIYSVLAMPLTIPVGLVPVVPNLPFFYLVYRTWSHWRAIAGGKHIQWLSKNRLLLEAPSETLDQLYDKDIPPIDDGHNYKEQMLLTQDHVKSFSDALEMPALAIELERAIWQVETAIQKEEAAEKAQQKTKVQEAAEGKKAQEKRKDE